MKFQSLMAAAMLLLAFDCGAMLLKPEAFPAGPGVTVALPPGLPLEAAPAPRQDAGADTYTYRNGDLVLDIESGAAAEILRASVDWFAHDARIAAARPQPAERSEHRPAPEPLPIGLLGLGFVLLGWTRLQGGLFDRLKTMTSLRDRLFPWPALSWLD